MFLVNVFYSIYIIIVTCFAFYMLKIKTLVLELLSLRKEQSFLYLLNHFIYEKTSNAAFQFTLSLDFLGRLKQLCCVF